MANPPARMFRRGIPYQESNPDYLLEEGESCVVTQLKEIPYRQPTAEAWVLSKMNALSCGHYSAGPGYTPR